MDSPTETRLTDRYRSLSFATPANFPHAMTVRRMANDVTYTMYAVLPIHYVYNLCSQLASWLDPSVSPVVKLVEQAAHPPSELVGDCVIQLHSSHLFSVVLTASHKIYWW